MKLSNPYIDLVQLRQIPNIYLIYPYNKNPTELKGCVKISLRTKASDLSIYWAYIFFAGQHRLEMNEGLLTTKMKVARALMAAAYATAIQTGRM